MNTPFGKIKLVKVIRGFLGRGSVTDEPANNSTLPISSDWAYKHEADNDEDIGRSKHLLKGIMNFLGDEDYEWDDFDTDEVDTEDIEELVEEGLDRYLERDGGTMTGQIALSGSGLVYLRFRPVLDQATISGLGKPVVVYRGLSRGFTMPIYTGGNLAELYFSEPHTPHRWDGKSDISVHCKGYLDTANTNKRFRLQMSWESYTSATDIVPTTSHDVETEKLTGTWEQFQSFETDFDIDYDIVSSDPIIYGDRLAMRIRRVAKTGTEDEIAGDVIITGVDMKYRCDKFGSAAYAAI